MLKELRGPEDEVILPVDKGNMPIMTRCDYNGKVEMMGMGTYGKLRGDPTATQENRLSRKLKGLEKDGEITSALYNRLRPEGSQVYRIPCSCGQVNIGETKWRLDTRLKEHRDACKRGMMEKSAVAQHVWENHHLIDWGGDHSAGPW